MIVYFKLLSYQQRKSTVKPIVLMSYKFLKRNLLNKLFHFSESSVLKLYPCLKNCKEEKRNNFLSIKSNFPKYSFKYQFYLFLFHTQQQQKIC